MIDAFWTGLVIASIAGSWFKKKIYIHGNEILISKNLLGIEKVYINEKVIISKFGWAGGTHQFKMEDVEYEVSFFFKQLFLSVGIELKRGDEIIYSEKQK